MPHLVKASTVAFLKKRFRELSSENTQQFLDNLSPHLQTLYQTSLAGTWITDEEDNQLVDAAIPVLIPESESGYLAFGRMVAQSNLSGPYRIFLKIPSRAYIFKRAANLWRTLNQAGDATISGETNNSVTFNIKNLPDMRFYQKQFTLAYVQIILETTGAKNSHVDYIEEDPATFKWVGRWD